jgi:hypothetical protein
MYTPMDWSPLIHAADRVPRDVPVRDGTDLLHASGLGARANGRPVLVPYMWRRGDAARDAEVAMLVASARARARAAWLREVRHARSGVAE